MLKKLLCVMISALMVISVLPVGVFAADTVEIDGTTYEVIFSEDVGVASGNWNSFTLSSSSSFLTALQTSGAYLVITRDSSESGASYDNLKFGDTWYSGTSATMDLLSPDIGSGTVVGFLASDVYTEWVDGGNSNGGDPMFISNTAASYTITNISVVTVSSSSASTTTTTTEYTDANGLTVTNYWSTTVSGTTITYDGSAWAEAYVNVPVDLSDCDSITVTVSGVVGSVQVKLYYADGTNGYVPLPSDGTYTIALTSALSSFTIQDSAGSSATTVTVDSVAVTKTTSGTTVVPTTSSRNQGVIYINEDYHGIFVTRTVGTSTRKYLVNVPHTVGSDGYCTVCKMYVGGEETEASTTTIDGVEYEEAYSVDVSLGSSDGWGQLDLGDTALIDALSQEGALLVITRDGVSDTVHNGSETYEKFGLVNSWWSGSWIALGTAGHTSATEEGTLDCISDDGTTAIYDGATVYNEWVARGMNAGGTVLLISNTSNTLKISNVTVYVPAGTVVTETVDVDEPAEDTNTETEDDELDVDDTDAEEVTETNPTTGAVLALVPMAIAGFAVVASKRR